MSGCDRCKNLSLNQLGQMKLANRSALMRMAGNIAAGLVLVPGYSEGPTQVARKAVMIARLIIDEVDGKDA